MPEANTQLNPQQLAAATHATGPAIVLAGAGSGKTRVLAHRVGWLLHEQKVQPQHIMVVTFTNKAAQEMKHRITALTGKKLWQAGTFHGMCARILRMHGSAIGLDKQFVIYDTTDQVKLIKMICEQQNVDTKKLSPKAALHSISGAKNELLDPESFATGAQSYYQKQVAKIYAQYQQELYKAQAVDFDDLLTKAVELLQVDEQTRSFYQETIHHLLIDEYQDTNKAQYMLTKLIAAPQNNVFVVGDFSQSIYSWRGADYRNMLLLKQDFPDITEYKLEQNYRSQQSILSAATQVISNNTRHPVLSLWTEKTQTSPVLLYGAEDAWDEARYIVNAIRSRKKNGTHLAEMAVLYRTNAQSRVFEDVLLQYGIPYKIIGGTNFYERKEIKDVLAYLRLLANQHDVVSHDRVSNLGKRRFQAFSTLLDQKEKLLKHTPQEILSRIIETTDYLQKFKKNTEENLQRQANVAELVSVASQFSDVSNFLENISLVQNNELADERTTDGDQYVSLMSLHAAKGLEFDTVFMTGLEDGLLPHSRSLFDPDQFEEERRLCYVGMTRAKEQLYLSYAARRAQFGSTTKSIMSRFINEVDGSLLQPVGAAPKAFTEKRKVVPIDDDLMEGVLSGDIDLTTFIES